MSWHLLLRWDINGHDYTTGMYEIANNKINRSFLKKLSSSILVHPKFGMDIDGQVVPAQENRCPEGVLGPGFQ